jgi:zinc-binding alcohol dehydrogenase family protein
MRAFGFSTPFSERAQNYVEELALDLEVPRDHDLVVEVKGVAVNPVDTKVRARASASPDSPQVLGYDAAGIVRDVGAKVSRFAAGDQVFYAGDITRPGTFSELHLVDERIVGRKPKSLGFAEAAALPLTSIAAWELLFDRFGVPREESTTGNLLIVGGAGGVGSILIQLARRLTGLTVIATASRPDTVAWCERMGAHHVINHHQPLAPQVEAAGVGALDFAASLTKTDLHFEAIIDMMKPGGKIGAIDDPGVLDVSPMKTKALSFHWEFMFARPMFETNDMDEQGRLLNEVSKLVDEGAVENTATKRFDEITADNLNEALIHQASGAAIGKTALG